MSKELSCVRSLTNIYELKREKGKLSRSCSTLVWRQSVTKSHFQSLRIRFCGPESKKFPLPMAGMPETWLGCCWGWWCGGPTWEGGGSGPLWPGYISLSLKLSSCSSIVCPMWSVLVPGTAGVFRPQNRSLNPRGPLGGPCGGGPCRWEIPWAVFWTSPCKSFGENLGGLASGKTILIKVNSGKESLVSLYL